jgi:hypothetical protein
MSDETTYHVWRDSRRKGSDLLFLLYLAQQADDWGYCFPSVPRIAERIRMSERAVQLIKRSLLNRDSSKEPCELRIFASAGPRSPDILQVVCGLSEADIHESELRSPIAQAVRAGKTFQEIYAAGKLGRGAKIAPQEARGEKSAPHSSRGEKIAPLDKTQQSPVKTHRGEKIAPKLRSVVIKNKKQQGLNEPEELSLVHLSSNEKKEFHAILEGVGFQGKIPDFILAAMKNNKRIIRSWYYSVIRLEGNDRKYMGGRFRTGVESGRMAPGWKDPVVYRNKQVMRCDVPVGEGK